MHQSTLSRVLKRNIGKRGNRFIQANSKVINRRTRAVSYRDMTLETIEMIEHITSKLKEKWSPEANNWSIKEWY